MAHFAEINDQNIVQRVIVFDVKDAPESDGEQLCAAIYGGQWKQTSYNARIRKNYAGVGFSYDAQRDAFIAPKPYASWILDEATCQWKSPNPKPDTGYNYRWSEPLNTWVVTNKYLFDAYGLSQDYELIRPTVEKYAMVNSKFVSLLQKPDYHVQLERANNILFVHARVQKWTPEIKQAYTEDINILHKEIGTDIYAYSFTPNDEYAATDPDAVINLKKFSALFGFEELEDVLLGDGYEHFIMRRPLAAAYG